MFQPFYQSVSRLFRSFLLLLVGAVLSGCQRSEPPVDLIKPQREAMEKTKAVEQVMQSGVNNADRKIDEESK